MSHTDNALLRDTLNLKDKYSIDIFVESGCQNGDSLDILSTHFNKLYSCDIDDNYVVISQLRFVEYPHIEVVGMDGAVHLEYLFKEGKIDKTNFILFSDGHHLRDKRNTSQLDELDVMIKLGLKPIVIYHDFKNPNIPTMEYDTFDVGENNIELIKDKLDICYGLNNYDMIYNTESNSNTGYVTIIPK